MKRYDEEILHWPRTARVSYAKSVFEARRYVARDTRRRTTSGLIGLVMAELLALEDRPGFRLALKEYLAELVKQKERERGRAKRLRAKKAGG